jgi:hypothetical protein
MIYKVTHSSTTTKMFEIEIKKMVGEFLPKVLANIVAEMMAPRDLNTLEDWIDAHHDLCEIYNKERAFVDNLRSNHSDKTLAPLEKYLRKARKYIKNLASTFILMGTYTEMEAGNLSTYRWLILETIQIPITLNSKKRLRTRGDEPISQEVKDEIDQMLGGGRIEIMNMVESIVKARDIEGQPSTISCEDVNKWVAAIEDVAM